MTEGFVSLCVPALNQLETSAGQYNDTKQISWYNILNIFGNIYFRRYYLSPLIQFYW